MNVKELISELEKIDDNELEIFVYDFNGKNRSNITSMNILSEELVMTVDVNNRPFQGGNYEK